MSLATIRNVLAQKANKSHAVILQRFFKTGPGEYGEGDVFHGIKVPVLRTISKQFQHLSLQDIQAMLKSIYHEERLVALFILVLKFKKADVTERERIFNFYMKNSKRINNWDLVDLSADKIVGAYLFDKDIALLTELSGSDNLWERRISIIATFYFIRAGVFEPTLRIASKLLRDKHDLIHKAVGWMLREIGKRDLETEEEFLLLHYKTMPRTMLRYAIERFPEAKRQAYLKGTAK